MTEDHIRTNRVCPEGKEDPGVLHMRIRWIAVGMVTVICVTIGYFVYESLQNAQRPGVQGFIDRIITRDYTNTRLGGYHTVYQEEKDLVNCGSSSLPEIERAIEERDMTPEAGMRLIRVYLQITGCDGLSRSFEFVQRFPEACRAIVDSVSEEIGHRHEEWLIRKVDKGSGVERKRCARIVGIHCELSDALSLYGTRWRISYYLAKMI